MYDEMRVLQTSLKRLRNIWNDKAGDILIVTGFIASTPDRTPTTLKRDGSDFSATIFAALLEAKIVTIWTDVDGVFSADPRKVETSWTIVILARPDNNPMSSSDSL